MSDVFAEVEPTESNTRILNRIVDVVREHMSHCTVTINFLQSDSFKQQFGTDDGRRIEVIAETKEPFSYLWMRRLYYDWCRINASLHGKRVPLVPIVLYETSYDPDLLPWYRRTRRVRISFNPHCAWPEVVLNSVYREVEEVERRTSFDLSSTAAILDPRDLASHKAS